MFRFSDDGEPSGTAGRPILSMIDKHNLHRTVLIVTRYFGGTKLGTGGLIRAYRECAEQTIRQARIIRRVKYRYLKITYPFAMINKVQHLVDQYNAQIREDASESGMKAEIGVPQSLVSRFLNELQSRTAGRADILKPPESDANDR